MKTSLVRLALVCAAAMFFAQPASATRTWISGVGDDVKGLAIPGVHVHFGRAAGAGDLNVKTDANGAAEINLPPGDYEVAIDAESVAAAMSKLAPPPERKSEGSSASGADKGSGQPRIFVLHCHILDHEGKAKIADLETPYRPGTALAGFHIHVNPTRMVAGGLGSKAQGAIDPSGVKVGMMIWATFEHVSE